MVQQNNSFWPQMIACTIFEVKEQWYDSTSLWIQIYSPQKKQGHLYWAM